MTKKSKVNNTLLFKKTEQSCIAVVIPCYRVKNHILDVIAEIGLEVSQIYVVDDNCPEGTGDFVKENCDDDRVRVLNNDINLGVGGAVKEGYKVAIKEGADIIVKIDGDGQMDPGLIPSFVGPIIAGEADYTKGNRFFDLEEIRVMPKIRLFGNASLSFMTKLSSGYWNLMDPTNGYTAIHADIVRHLPLKKISNRYFFETDMLFRLCTLRAVVIDIPMDANYGDEASNMKIHKIVGEFFIKHICNFVKRLFYNYYLRDIAIGSIELPVGLLLLTFGIIYGISKWVIYGQNNMATPVGTVMISALSILMGLQLVLAFLSYDIASVPRNTIHRRFFCKPKSKKTLTNSKSSC